MFVAAFIGGFSLLQGFAIQRQFRPDGSIGGHLTARQELEGVCALVIGPEDARPAGTFPGNCLSVQVVSRAFQGRCWQLVVSNHGHKVRIDWPAGLGEGENVTFSLQPDGSALVAA